MSKKRSARDLAMKTPLISTDLIRLGKHGLSQQVPSECDQKKVPMPVWHSLHEPDEGTRQKNAAPRQSDTWMQVDQLNHKLS